MKRNFLYQITAASRAPNQGGYRPPDPRSLCPVSSTEFVETPSPYKIHGYATGFLQPTRDVFNKPLFHLRGLCSLSYHANRMNAKLD